MDTRYAKHCQELPEMSARLMLWGDGHREVV